MLYQKRSFTVPATGTTNLCTEKGKHSATDARGRCMNCGEVVVEVHVLHINENDGPTSIGGEGWHPSKQFPGFDERDIGAHIREHRPSIAPHTGS